MDFLKKLKETKKKIGEIYLNPQDVTVLQDALLAYIDNGMYSEEDFDTIEQLMMDLKEISKRQNS